MGFDDANPYPGRLAGLTLTAGAAQADEGMDARNCRSFRTPCGAGFEERPAALPTLPVRRWRRWYRWAVAPPASSPAQGWW